LAVLWVRKMVEKRAAYWVVRMAAMMVERKAG
jgi:hypothetical protein